jgi:hypothetical protein
MRIIQCSGSLQFDQKRLLDHQIDDVFTNRHAIINDGETMLLRDSQSGLAQLMGQGIFIDFLQKPNPERIEHGKRTAYDPPRQVIQPVFIRYYVATATTR